MLTTKNGRLAAEPAKSYGPLRVPEGLSASPLKRELFAVDTYFRETWDDIRDAWSEERAVAEARRLAFMVFKPDAIVGRRILPALDFLAEHGFRPASYATFRYTRHTIREAWRYQFNIASRQRIAIVDILLPTTDSLFVLLRDEAGDGRVSAAERLTDLKGSTKQAEQLPHHLRSRLRSTAPLLNFVHTSDEPADVVRELGVYFDVPQRLKIIADVEGRADRHDEVSSFAEQLYERVPAHDLNLQATVKRIEDLCRPRAEADGDDRSRRAAPVLREILADCEQLRNGHEIDWQVLFARFEAIGLEVPLWDRIVVATEMTRCDIPGALPVL